VRIMLTGNGFEVIDMGVDVDPQRFFEAAVEKEASLIAMSALLTMSIPIMQKTVEKLRKAGLETNIKTMVGGAT
jgi:5-methyltetrahydrofolate--homocysteine methyltransferase